MHTLLARSIALLSSLCVIKAAGIPTASTNAVDARSLEGKVLFGYQGFFRRPGQGNDHWTIKGLVPGPSTPGDGKNPISSRYFAIYEAPEDADISKSNLTRSPR